MKESCCRGETKGPHGACAFLGRLLISLIFILGGIGKIIDFQGAKALLASVGIDGGGIYTFLALLLELVGGILLLLGWKTKYGIYLLMIFLIPATFIVHGFWNYQGVDMVIQFQMFLKNLAIYGGLLAFLSFGPGKWSLDAACEKRGA